MAGTVADFPRFELRRRNDGNLLVGILCLPPNEYIVWRPPVGLTLAGYPDPDVYQWRRVDENGESEPSVHHVYVDGVGWTSTVGARNEYSDGPEPVVPPIPDVWTADVAAAVDANLYSAEDKPVEQLIVEAAAPHIVRAAQVQVLREMAEEVDHEADMSYREVAGVPHTLLGVGERLRERADQIERGGATG